MQNTPPELIGYSLVLSSSHEIKVNISLQVSLENPEFPISLLKHVNSPTIFLFHFSPHTQLGKIIESVDQTQGVRFLFPLDTGKRIKSEG